MAAPSVLQAAAKNSNNATTTSLAITLGSTPTVGNLMRSAVNIHSGVSTVNGSGSYGGNNAVTLPTGWTLVAVQNSTTLHGLVIAERVVVSGDGTSYTWTFGTTDYNSGTIREISGQASSGWADQSAGQNNASSGSSASPSITPSQAYCLILCDFDVGGNEATPTTPSGWTLDANALQGSGAAGAAVGVYSIDQQQTTAVAVSTSITLAQAHSSCVYIAAILPDPYPAYKLIENAWTNPVNRW